MERLTEWIGAGEDRKAIPRMDLKNNGHERCMNRLAEYEDLDEQGLLLKFPCKLGDTLYWISDLDEDGNEKRTIMPTKPVVAIAIKKDGVYVSIYEGLYDKLGSRFAFVTREDAEEALKKMNDTEI